MKRGRITSQFLECCYTSAFGKIPKCPPLLLTFPLPDLHFSLPSSHHFLLRTHYMAYLKAGIQSKPWRMVEGASCTCLLRPAFPPKFPATSAATRGFPDTSANGRPHNFTTKLPNITLPLCPFRKRFLGCLECLKNPTPYLFLIHLFIATALQSIQLRAKLFTL